MDWKLVVIGGLVITAVLLGGLVASGLRQDAYAQGGVYSTYLAATANVQSDMAHFIILDTAMRRMWFYRVDTTKLTLEPTSAADLKTDFQSHAAP